MWIATPKSAVMARMNPLVAMTIVAKTMAAGKTHQNWEKVSMPFGGVNVPSLGFFMI